MTRGTGATAVTDSPTHPRAPGGDAGTAGGPPDGRPRRRWWLLALLVGMLVAGVALVVGGDDSDSSSAPPVSTPVPEDLGPRLDAEGGELADLLALGRDAELHATYEASGTQDGMTIELWRKDGLVREDTHLETDAGSADTAGFLLEDGLSVSCVRRDGGEWTCSSSVAESSPDGIFGSVVQRLGGLDVVGRDGAIEGRDVRCFEFGAAGGDGEICVTQEGIPVRATVGESSIELVDLETSVNEDVFELPAPVEER